VTVRKQKPHDGGFVLSPEIMMHTRWIDDRQGDQRAILHSYLWGAINQSRCAHGTDLNLACSYCSETWRKVNARESD